MIEVFTDGACSGNPGSGGWGAVIIYPSTQEEHLSGAVAKTTNNRMEMQAAIEALNHLPEGKDVRVTTDSEYVMKGMTEWLSGWIKNDWKTRNRKPVKNQEEWKALLAATKRHKSVAWAWVRGHRGHPQNEMADHLATSAIVRLESAAHEEETRRIEQLDSPSLADAPLRQVSAEKDVRVIRTDNYDTPNPIEYFVAQRLTMDQAVAVAHALNAIQDADAADYYKVVSGDYRLAAPK